tara:strand:+ start:801 stop:1079 length:279 start_codon:yes stop_codon:yes gene_type:complete
MGVFMVPLYDHEGTDKEWIDRELKLTGRDEDLMSLMDEHEFFIMYTNDKGGDDTFVVIHWDEFHIETLKEEFPEWSHEFFEMWEGHCNFMIS